jgi:hypothetical protein
MLLPFGIDLTEVARTLSFLATGAMVMYVIMERRMRLDHMQPCYCPVDDCAHCYDEEACPKCGGLLVQVEIDNHGGSYEGTRTAIACARCGCEYVEPDAGVEEDVTQAEGIPKKEGSAE